MTLSATYVEIRSQAEAVAGGPHDVYQRLSALRAIEDDASGNAVFPATALHDRTAFVYFYTDFYFTRDCGHLPEARSLVDPALLHLLNRLHATANAGDLLPAGERRALFSTACAVYGQARAGAAVALA